MVVKIVGKQIVSYFSKKKQKQIEGLSLYFNADKQGVDGLFTDNLWIDKNSALYGRMLPLNVSKPVDVNVFYEMIPGNSYPQLVDIKAV